MAMDPNNFNIYEQFLLVVRFARKAWLHRRLALAISAVLSFVGWGYVLTTPDIYQASTRVHVDSNSMMTQLLRGLAADTSSVQAEFLRVARSTLTSRPNLMRVAREADLAIEASDTVAQDRLLERLRAGITLKATSTGRRAQDNLVTIQYRHGNPDTALAVVRSLLDIFMESVLDSQQRDTSGTQEFLDQQIREYRRRMDDAEARLKSFRREHVQTLPTHGNGFFAAYQEAANQVEAAQTRLRSARRQQASIQARLDEIKRAGDDAGSGDGATRPEVEQLRAQLATLLLTYTENHPDVQAIRQKLRAYTDDPSLRSNGSGDATDADIIRAITGNRMVDELSIELARARSNVAAAEAELEVSQERMARTLEALTNMPEVEAELTRLTREFELNRSQYEAFVQRRESAAVSRDAALSADKDVFQIIDPPYVTPTPVAPNRTLLITAVLVLSCGIGVAAALGVSLIQDTYGDTRELRARTGLVVLGRVGMVRSAAEQRLRRMSYVGYVLAALGLASAYGYLLLAVGMGVLPVPQAIQLWAHG